MLSLPTAILIAGILIGIGLPVTIIAFCYFAYKMMMSATIFRFSDNANDSAYLHRQLLNKAPKAPDMPPEAHDIEIASMSDNPEAMENLRRNQDPSSAY